MSLLLLSPVFLAFIVIYRLSARRHPLPPGPPPKFLTGNIHQVPPTHPWRTYEKWGLQYGPMVYFRIMQKKFIVLHTFKAATDLLDARAGIYSERPTTVFFGDLIGRQEAVFYLPSTHRNFKKYRKYLTSGLNARATRSYAEVSKDEVHVLLLNLMKNPEQFTHHFRRYAGAVILKVTYGWTVSNTGDDQLVSLIEQAARLQPELVRPGRWMVDTIPLLKYVPAWFPFASFQKAALEYKAIFSRIDQYPWEWTKQQVTSGTYTDSFASKHILELDSLPPEEAAEEDKIARFCSAGLYSGGAETIVGVLTAFTLAMTLYPDVQARIQEELATIVGQRLPTVDDKDSLPYLNAVLWEVLRWAPIAPVALPHRVLEDDVYEGYLVPKGTVVIPNIWAMTRDESVYPAPDVFDPERYLGKTPQRDPRRMVFGFGRRVCPGAHFAETSIFLVMGSIMTAFNITKALDDAGKEIIPAVEFSSNITSHPLPFECKVTARAPDLLASL
ncbi:uncharacterized protein FIBRA_08426 [Fibroporia radiculosa]|uniref:Cytochrome P450 n=1 Tax=Fibroporia radiculosa TaxID=599839 RepID=J4H562_9APHY|nr:uncharacterized protein FIBRA_08426 [Fibroporia radiculosa]CCM06184.1 predicted protein [Fibroporia radiculosa]